MDWSELERRSHIDNNKAQIKIDTKRVAVRRDQLRKLPDGTVIIIPDKNKK